MEMRSFTTEVNARTLTIPALTVLFSALFVSLWPAVRAARTEPARSIRIF
jgi:ABC-type lipoprotein release transport system permease subunit